MANAMARDQNSFSCPICLDLLKDPVTIPCGHSYCMDCIKHCWNEDQHPEGVYSCPQCRQAFSPRPALNKSTLIVEMMEKMMNAGLLMTPATQSYTGEVSCDVCSGKKLKAIKSCLVCLASYCETHLRPHYESPAFQKHSLVKASTQLQEQICTHHGKLLEAYCRTDQQCVCMLCMLDEHKGHNIVSAATERAEKQKQMVNTKGKFKQQIEEREKELQELRKAVESYKSCAQAALEDSEKIFTELIRSIEKTCSEVKQLIRAREKATVSRAEELLVLLEQEIAELKGRDNELEQLLHTENHIHSLQRFPAFCASPGSAALPSIAVNQLYTFKDVVKYVSELKDGLENLCKQDVVKISRDVNLVGITEPLTREDFLQYSCQLTLDPNTAHKHLYLTERNKKGSYINSPQAYPDNPERFEKSSQVLCCEGLTGRNYWEVELDGKDGLSVAVSYKSIGRKGWGFECLFGCDQQSWRLDCSSRAVSFWHNNRKLQISAALGSSRLGIYLDHRAGALCFYSITDSMILLHKVKTAFTQPLYPGFGFGYYGSTIKICDSNL
ncbi:E3 ubiquitin/ISG15 ligase TRIM25-like [Salminus brasiliensis]|uniref:E3 ubiquitin/ISG15 ligase TRIM25-like n=1 Tax=Salminus brasiliensis TaxID=930266 RepID=UPI003B8383F0